MLMLQVTWLRGRLPDSAMGQTEADLKCVLRAVPFTGEVLPSGHEHTPHQ